MIMIIVRMMGNPVEKSEREPRLREFFSTTSMLDDDDGGDDLADDVRNDKKCCEDDRENQQDRKGLKLLPLIHTRARATIILFCKRVSN